MAVSFPIDLQRVLVEVLAIAKEKGAEGEAASKRVIVPDGPKIVLWHWQANCMSDWTSTQSP